MRDRDAVWAAFRSLWSDIGPDQSFFEQKPLLAHYTSMGALEKIVSSNQMWFANPLFMNDVEEVRFGINEGTNCFLQDETIRTTLGDTYDKFEDALLRAHSWFDSQHAFDTYVLCLSEHDEGDEDGVLSMWRGYGDGGRGVALVFDARSMSAVQNTPLIVSKVTYGSREQRMAWFTKAAASFATIWRQSEISLDELPAAVDALFSRLRTFSLFSKHSGFREEREWRLAYMPEFDRTGLLKQYLSYFNGPRGVEPKLKLPIAPIPELGGGLLSLETLVHSIILGPTLSSPLALASAKRMLTSLGRVELAERVLASRIPYRAN
jgi:hypothetical protein